MHTSVTHTHTPSRSVRVAPLEEGNNTGCRSPVIFLKACDDDHCTNPLSARSISQGVPDRVTRLKKPQFISQAWARWSQSILERSSLSPGPSQEENAPDEEAYKGTADDPDGGTVR